MKTYEQRTQDIQSKIKKKKTQRRAIAATVTACCCIALALLLYQPAERTSPNASAHKQHEYYDLIKVLRNLQASNYYYDSPTQSLDGIMEAVPDANVPVESPAGSANSSGDTGSYEEVTDLQVEGVGEADLIKRSDNHIFYLRDGTLTVYSIAGKESALLGSYTPEAPEGDYGFIYNYEMYLSQDCNTVTLISQVTGDQGFTRILSLDVSDPTNIRLAAEQHLSGSFISSRMIGDKLYMITRFSVQSAKDIEDKPAYLPSYQVNGETVYLTMDDIVIPEDPAQARYTVITQVDEKSLEVKDTVALLSYSGVEYVSQNNFFLTRSYSDTVKDGEIVHTASMTEISQIRYGEDGLEHIASFSIAGTVNNQYNLDEKDGILRVVTTVRDQKRKEYSKGFSTYTTFLSETVNASLYCIDLSSHTVRASVESFAPEGETVRSVRFDGDNAYVCTAIELRDPVFFFDLSDLDNITYKDTGTIDGYSMSLVDFTDGFLMGIGYGESFDTLKIEIYQEGKSTVESYCSFENPCTFSSDYKAYYIDRENQLIGLGILEHPYGSGYREYLLLYFDGYELQIILRTSLNGDLDEMRSVFIDGYLYMFGDEFIVEKIA